MCHPLTQVCVREGLSQRDSAARTSLCAVGFQSVLITVGGSIIVNGKWIQLATTELIDTTNGCWYTCDDLPIPHCQLKAAIVSNKL